MDNKHGREHLNPLRKKFVSPQGNRKSQKSPGISSKVKANMKELHKFSQRDKKDSNLKKKLYEMKKDKSLTYRLGGNSCDPLNLYSLIDRDPMLNTPQASPHPMHGDSPIEISYPHDYKDPLNLKCYPEGDCKEGVTPKKKKKRKHKNRQHDIENNEQKEEKQENKVMEKSEKSKEKKKKKRSKKVKCEVNNAEVKEQDKEEVKSDIVESEAQETKNADQNSKEDQAEDEEPPRKKTKSCKDNLHDKKRDVNTKEQEDIECKAEVPGQCSKIHGSNQKSPTPTFQRKEKRDFGPKKKESRKNQKLFIYGNYNRYYNYRNPQSSEDPRLKCFRKEWFNKKDVLDIGCNVGNVTFAVARQFEPRIIIGNDIDNSLIKIAKANAQVFALQNLSSKSSSGKDFPLSFAVTNGPIAAPVLLTNDKEQDKLEFPKNIIFKQENYVPLNEKGLLNQRPMFDTILCLSVSKWVHLNWGDQGIKLMFKKIYKNLRPGGRLILEPQPFASYSKRKKLTEKIRSNYDRICFRPEQFVDYLLSDEVGFVAYEVLEEPQHGAQGFRRPMYLFTKGTSKTPQATDKTSTPSSR